MLASVCYFLFVIHRESQLDNAVGFILCLLLQLSTFVVFTNDSR